MTRVIGPPKSRRRRWTILFSVLVAVGFGVLFIPGALAVHDTGAFELDSGAAGANAVTDHAGTGAPDDWDRVCHQVLAADCSTTNNTNGATGVAWGDDRTVTAECAGGDNCTVFTGGGSKDPSDISSWNWKTDSGGLPAKDNLQQGFAARYSLPGTVSTGTCPNGTDIDANGNPSPSTFDPNVKCSVVYFGSTRVANNGDAQQGVWFLQNRVGLNTDGTFCAVDATNTCTGAAHHKAGDVLIVSDFSTGGATALIAVYKWVDSGGDISANIQSLGGTPAGGTAECGHTTPATGDPFCGIVNLAQATSPWPFLDKSGNTFFDNGELYEAGINLSLFKGLASECFATIVDESRASAGNTSATSPFATLKDFIISAFQPCTSGITTTPQHSTITLGSTINDGAVVTGTGAGTPTGTVKFFICNPQQTTLDANNNPQCKSPNGTQIGTTAGEPLTADPNDPTKANATSATVTPGTSPLTANPATGTWCFRGEYVPATGSQYKGAVDDTTTECFTVVNVIMATAQTVTLKDTATITPQGGATVGGTVRFRLYENAGCTGTALYDSGSAKTFSNSTSAVSVDSDAVTITTTKSVLSWLVEYTHGTGATAKDVTSSCSIENAAVTINNG